MKKEIDKRNNYIVRQATLKDSKRIWEIKNHRLNRKYSYNRGDIEFSEHVKWFKNKYFDNKKNVCFVLNIKDAGIVGYCRFDLDNNIYLVSIALDPDYQSRGLGHRLLSNSLNKIIIDNKNIIAKTKLDNIPSIKLFKKNNFKIYKKDKNNCYLKYNLE